MENPTKETALLSVYSHIEYPFDVVKGDGVYVYDSSGKAYLDFYGGHCVCPIGHSPKVVADAISKQVKELLFYSNLAPIPLRREAADELLAFANNGFSKAFFCNSGAEANENALKISIKKTGRQKIACFKGSFHGRTALAMSATDHPKWHEIYKQWIGPFVQLIPNDISSLSLLDETIAALILEPIQSIGGVTVFQPEFLKILRKKCLELGIMLIFDEVQTGIGRTGTPFVSGYCGVLPDMMTLAKGLASGLPIGSVVMTQDVASSVTPGDIAATFGGGPVVMSAMKATLTEIQSKNLCVHAKQIENYVYKVFQIPQVKGIRGKGCLLGLVLETAAKPIQKALFEKGIIVGLNSNPNLVHLLPPLIIEESHVDQLKEALLEVMEK